MKKGISDIIYEIAVHGDYNPTSRKFADFVASDIVCYLQRKGKNRYKTKKEMIKDIQRILLTNKYDVLSTFKTTKYMSDNLVTCLAWLKNKGYGSDKTLDFKDIKGELYVIYPDGKKEKLPDGSFTKLIRSKLRKKGLIPKDEKKKKKKT